MTTRNGNGYTLIETIIVMTLLGVVMAVISTSMFRVGHLERRLRGYWEGERTFDRLSRRFRADVHRAGRVVSGTDTDSDDATGLRLFVGEDQTVVYRIDDAAVVREHHRGDALLHRDYFWLPQLANLSWQLTQESGHQMVVLVFTRNPASRFGDRDAALQRLEAAMDLSHRN